MGNPVYAYGGNGAAVIYEYANKTGVIRCGGKIGWRSTNPGNIKVGSYAKEFGSIGNNGQFAIFPSFLIGRAAIYNILHKSEYLRSTLEEAIRIYAPRVDNNDTEAYIDFLVEYSGFNRTDRLYSIDIWFLVDVIIKKEGYLNPANQGSFKFIDDVTKKKRYIWRTRKDPKVRSKHWEGRVKIFYWNDPPEGGHPGDDFGCRCWSEAFEYDECFEKANPWPKNHGFQIQIVTT